MRKNVGWVVFIAIIVAFFGYVFWSEYRKRAQATDPIAGSPAAQTEMTMSEAAEAAMTLSEAIKKGSLVSQAVTKQEIPSELEATLFGAWSSISPICPPSKSFSHSMGTDSLNPTIMKLNQASIGAALLKGVERTEDLAAKNLGNLMKTLVMAGVQATPAYFELKKLQELRVDSVTPTLTAAVCFCIVATNIVNDLGTTNLYIVESSLDINFSQSSLSIRVNLPASYAQRLAKPWASLFQNTLERPLTVLAGDTPREQLWKWIDGKPKLLVLDVTGKKVFEYQLKAPPLNR